MTEEKEGRKSNGWANDATWAVALWLGNDGPTYRYWVSQAERWHGKGTGACRLARQLKEEIGKAFPLHEPSLYSDLLNAALAEVDWIEIAEGYLSELSTNHSNRY